MLIAARVSGATVHLESKIPTTQKPAVTEQQSIAFALLPTANRDHLNLETGEVFRDFKRATAAEKENLISATLTVHPASSSEDHAHSTMRYLKELSGEEFFPSQIHFSVYIQAERFKRLEADTKAGTLPTQITIGFADPSFYSMRGGAKSDALTYGPDRDGSGIIWHNKENGIVSIESIRFDYTPIKVRYEKGEQERILAWDEPEPQAGAATRHKYEMSNWLYAMGIGLIVWGLVDWFFPSWAANTHVPPGDDQLLALMSFIGGAILISLNRSTQS